MNELTCREMKAESRTTCHAAARICDKLKGGDKDAETRRTIVARMGRTADLPQEVRDSVHACPITSADPGKLVREE